MIQKKTNNMHTHFDMTSAVKLKYPACGQHEQR